MKFLLTILKQLCVAFKAYVCHTEYYLLQNNLFIITLVWIYFKCKNLNHSKKECWSVEWPSTKIYLCHHKCMLHVMNLVCSRQDLHNITYWFCLYYICISCVIQWIITIWQWHSNDNKSIWDKTFWGSFLWWILIYWKLLLTAWY